MRMTLEEQEQTQVEQEQVLEAKLEEAESLATGKTRLLTYLNFLCFEYLLERHRDRQTEGKRASIWWFIPQMPTAATGEGGNWETGLMLGAGTHPCLPLLALLRRCVRSQGRKASQHSDADVLTRWLNTSPYFLSAIFSAIFFFLRFLSILK